MPQEATYAEAANDPKRDVLLVTDQKEGAVYAVSQNQAAPKKIAEAPQAYGAAYNNGWGWNAALGDAASSSTLALAAGAVLASLALLF